ncbi:hypothetical protein SAMN05216389_101270 [Oceanobacillus limi]|uniref:Uncharacterized protein n=1 Tax=Oceanobacillus limi TaxID=930131 RepID=A0A1H9Y9P2_9BACI|nr:DUF6019 family protein [Oceanobacillus limi]SES65507.1 hypothetical protein SAMN05216389_101270 [Oceanobacillus limi]
MGEFLTFLMNVFIYVIPIIILYFVIQAAVRNGINHSEVGKYILEKKEAEAKKRK